MQKQFFIIIDKRESEKFRKFKIGQFNQSTKKILQKNKSNFIWGIHKGNVSKSTWNELKKGDLVLLTTPKNNFELCGIVSKKLVDTELGKIMWNDDLNSSQINHFIFFNNLEQINFSYNELISYATIKNILPVSGIYQINKSYFYKIRNNIPSQQSNFSIPNKPKIFSYLPLTNGPPAKNKSEIYRFIRDPIKVKQLKEMYHNKCQICDYTFEYAKNKFYSEVHHYNPLEEGGNDDEDNMIVLCPNHHSEFDYKIIAIDRDGSSIINRKGEKIAKIKFEGDHKLSSINVNSQLRV